MNDIPDCVVLQFPSRLKNAPVPCRAKSACTKGGGDDCNPCSFPGGYYVPGEACPCGEKVLKHDVFFDREDYERWHGPIKFRRRDIRELLTNAGSLPKKLNTAQGHTLLVEAAAAIELARQHHPELSQNGWRYPGGPEPDHEHPLDVAHVATCLAFLDSSRAETSTRFSRYSRDSDTWRPIVERWGRGNGYSRFIAIGEVIAAALHRRVLTRRGPGPNSLIGLSVVKAVR